MTAGVLIIFGITGDLSRRYLLPALYHLTAADLLPQQFVIIGVTRRDLGADDIAATVRESLSSRGETMDEAVLKRMASMMRVVTMDMTVAGDYRRLKKVLDVLEDERGLCLNRLFYLSIPPHTYSTVVDFMGQADLQSGCAHGTAASRIMVEKPFGYDLASAQTLIDDLKAIFTEEQIYRIDHYLAKEMAQNIMTFRFANPIFSSIWDNRYIRSIDILVAETIGIEGRATFYDSVGALRDVVQSHLLQLLALVTLERPKRLDPMHLHAAKLALLDAITPISPAQVASQAVRGQYAGYGDEAGHPNSNTETFAAIRIGVDSEHWSGVPITLATGKKLDDRRTHITLAFADPHDREPDNILTFRVQPDEGIGLQVLAKIPGFTDETEPVAMSFSYRGSFQGRTQPDAYERVLADGIRGDQTLFASSDEVLSSWRVVDGVVSEWQKSASGLISYEPGTSPSALLEHLK